MKQVLYVLVKNIYYHHNVLVELLGLINPAGEFDFLMVDKAIEDCLNVRKCAYTYTYANKQTF